MGNVLRILKRDLLRLLKAPAALIVAGALLVLPSLYTWYNVVAFWNPYEATGNLKVCVVNEDVGAEHELTGKLNVGDRVEEELLANDKLNFVSDDNLETALEDLKAGDVYAVYVIPEDFSACLISPVTGTVKSPHIKYYANEKLGPVSPKITDTAANTLDQTINSMFVSTVSEAAVNAINEAADKADADVAAAKSKATTRMDEASKAIADVRTDLANIQDACSDAQGKVSSASAAMDDALALTADARTVLEDISNEVSAAQESLSNVASNAVGSLSSVLVDVSEVTAKASTAADGFVSKTGTAEARVDLAASRIQPLIDALAEISADLDGIAKDLPDDDPAKEELANAAQKLADREAQLQTLVDNAQALSAHISEIAQTASDVTNSLGESAQQVTDALQQYSDDLYGDAAPLINTSLSQVSVACERLSSATTDLDTTIREARVSLDQLHGLLGDCGSVITQTDMLIKDFQGDLESLSTDVNLLAQSNVISDILKNGTLNSQSISAFMAAPTELKTEKFYTPNAYGTAMAPLFMNLTFWIGAFMLVIIFKLEVDEEGIKRMTLWQRYLSRFMFFSGFAVIQALICCAGVLALGVEVANVPALFLASALSSLTFLSVIYALSATLQHIGKALCIVLVFAQIPGGSGLYPLELTDKFFQTIYPFLPFSYGIGALREAIGGFYGDYYVHDLAMLALMFVGTLVLGMILSPLMSNVIRMVARQVHEGDLYNGEEAIIPARPFYLTQVVHAMTDREDYREDLMRRYARFNKIYPIIIKASIALGVIGPLALGVLLAFNAGEKVVLLTIILLWLVGLVVLLVITESERYSFERQLNIDRMSDEHLLKVFFDRDRIRPAFSGGKKKAAATGKAGNGQASPAKASGKHGAKPAPKHAQQKTPITTSKSESGTEEADDA